MRQGMRPIYIYARELIHARYAPGMRRRHKNKEQENHKEKNKVKSPQTITGRGNIFLDSAGHREGSEEDVMEDG